MTDVSAPKANFHINAISNEAKCQSLKDVHCDVGYLQPREQHQLGQFLYDFRDLFAKDGDKPGRTTEVEHRIDLVPGSRPFKLPLRRVPLHLQGEVDNQVGDMLSADIIEPSSSEFSSPPVLVRKKDGRIRFCVDYRKLNGMTIKDSYPLPRIDDALDALGPKARYFSTLDLAMGYYHVPLDVRDRDKTAFPTRQGLFQFKVMPFGLCNAPGVFQRLMERVLSRLNWKDCLVYIDDVLVWSNSFEEHMRKLNEIFTIFRRTGLKLKTAKCNIVCSKVQFLGHLISSNGLAMDPARVQAISKMPRPTSRDELVSLLGLLSYYRRFIKDLASVDGPLLALTSGPVFSWSGACEDAFEQLKQTISRDVVLAFPDTSCEFIVDTDASNRGIGGVISQLDGGERERPVAFASRTLSERERNYPTMEKECLAVVWCDGSVPSVSVWWKIHLAH